MMIRERVDRVLRDQLGPGIQMDGETSFREGLKLDSLDLVEMTMRLEEEFTIRTEDGDIEHLDSLDQTVSWLEQRLDSKPAIF